MQDIQSFHRDALIAALSGNKIEYKEFMREPHVHCGIYHLATGQDDPQQPHSDDEIYYALAGQARFETEEETIDVTEGTILYVKANTKHRFVGITRDLTLLVFFASKPAGD